MRRRLFWFVVPACLAWTGANGATDWVAATDRYARADAAATLCAKPRGDLRQSFTDNYQAAVARAKVQLKQQYPAYGDAALTEMLRQRARRSADEVAMIIKQKGCRGPDTEGYLREYNKLASGVMFPLR